MPTAQAEEFSTCAARLHSEIVTETSKATADALFADVAEIPRVVAADRSQPEFTETFRAYYTKRVSATRIEKGRALLEEQSALLGELQHQYGVQAPYLVALWGLETNFGGYMGKLHIPSALTTLACDGRRAKFFASELKAVAQIVEAGHMQPAEMVGSWAGAMGHMQFMPSTFLAYAVNGDDTPGANVYQSLPDALASGANFLNHLGWRAGYRWGREVKLPENFDLSLAHENNWQPLSSWRAMGVTDVDGNPVADLELSSAIVLPSGHQGPAFAVYPNFRVLMRWNRSVNYALSVGRLADRIAGLGALDQPWPKDEDIQLSSSEIKFIQSTLGQRGFDAGPSDGIAGAGTRAAIRAYQAEAGLPPDGFPSRALLAALKAPGE